MKDEVVKEIIDRYDNDAGMLISMLQDLQAVHGYLPPKQLRVLSKKLNIPLIRIYSVATFYASFRHAPKGAHEITLCMGTVCYLKGSKQISDTICEEYSIEPGSTTSDRLFTLNAVNCVGACAVAPVMVIDGKYYGNMTPQSALKIIHGLDFSSEEDDTKKTKKSMKEVSNRRSNRE